MAKAPIKTHATLYRIPELILVCLFAVCTLLAAAYGLNSYHKVQRGTELSFTGRTGLTYVASKMRQSHAVSVDIPNPFTLVLVEETQGQNYATSIFLKDGMLREYFGSYTPNTATFDTPITAASEFSVAFLAEDLIEITVGDCEGNLYKMAVYMPLIMNRALAQERRYTLARPPIQDQTQFLLSQEADL